MKFYIVLFIGILFVTACGGSKEAKKQEVKKAELIVTSIKDKNQTKKIIPDVNSSQTDQVQTVIDNIVKPQIEQNTTLEQISRIVTIYIHGYHKEGYKRVGVYGDISYDSVLDKFVEFTNLPTMQDYDKNSFTNVLAITPYYGDEPPSYYTQTDIDDIARVGDGIPRYAMIVAKFAKYIMKESGADNINIISASMGSLVIRWLIEKDIENLASEKKIQKWMSIEGVIKGNYALSKKLFVSLADNYFEKSVDTEHMSYSWVNSNLSQSSPYYNDIRIGQISGTDSETNSIGLNYLMIGNFKPNDGYQLYRDTYFDNQNFTHSMFHVDHIGIKKDNGAYINVTSFMESKRRVKITLMDVTVDDIHERINRFFNKNAEIVFESQVFSYESARRWGIGDAISERVFNSGALKVYGYEEDGETKEINQVIFNDYVLNGEKDLEIKMKSYEIDRSSKYNISELNSNTRTLLGDATVTIPLKDGTYEIISDDEWRGFLKVEMITDN
jgi:hypothetical protein